MSLLLAGSFYFLATLFKYCMSQKKKRIDFHQPTSEIDTLYKVCIVLSINEVRATAGLDDSCDQRLKLGS